MLALKGYFNGKDVILLEKVDIKRNQKVIITVLDEYLSIDVKSEKAYKKYIGKLNTESFIEISEALKRCDNGC